MLCNATASVSNNHKPLPSVLSTASSVFTKVLAFDLALPSVQGNYIVSYLDYLLLKDQSPQAALANVQQAVQTLWSFWWILKFHQ